MKYTEKDLLARIAEVPGRTHRENPMAASITNSVTINLVANAQLAAGGSAAMVYLPDEGEAMAAAGRSLYINMGTLMPFYAETLPRTARRLCELGRPWVLDPVALGIGALRTELLRQFAQFRPGIIRGNASEILALATLWGLAEGRVDRVRGVDSTDQVADAKEAARALARHTGGAVAISGETDYVTDGENGFTSFGGSKFLPMITGAGCSLGGVMAIYASVAEPFVAAAAAAALYNVAGAAAEKRARGPGSFLVEFLDEIYAATGKALADNRFELDA